LQFYTFNDFVAKLYKLIIFFTYVILESCVQTVGGGLERPGGTDQWR